jgi:hypothetical protein
VAAGDVSPSSFEFYEGIRIIIPGAFALALYAAIGQTFGFPTGAVSSNALSGVVGALGIGLLLYFFDLPSRSAAFRMDLPGEVLKRWDDGRGAVTPANRYFVIFDEKLPRVAFNRALYYGSIFRIGFEGIYLAAVVPLIVIASGTLAPMVGIARNPDTETRVAFWVAGALHLVILSGAVITRRSWWGTRERRTKRRNPDHEIRPWKRLREEFSYEIPGPDRLALSIGIIAGAIYFCTNSVDAAVVAIALPASVWAFRYFRGYEAPEMIGPVDKRPPITPTTALTAIRALNAVGASMGYSVAAATTLFIAAHRAPESTPLDRLTSIAWALLSLAAGLLIAFRGHERKLAGSYSGQRAWLELNRDALIRDYFPPDLSTQPAGAQPEAPDVTQSGANRFKLLVAIAAPVAFAVAWKRRTS